MNIVILSYGVIGHDGRLKELIKSCEQIGETVVIAIAVDEKNSSASTFKLDTRESRFSPLNYLKFILHSIKIIRKMKSLDILVIDDFTSSFLGFIINALFRPKLLVQDARELYIDNKMPGLGNVFMYFEQKMFKKADLLVCANEQRSKIMKERYDLVEAPYVFENIRILEGDYDKRNLDNKYNFLKNKKLKIISTGGCSIARGTKNLVLSMKHLPEYELYIVGKGRLEDYNQTKLLIANEELSNVHILDRVPLNELLYLVRSCDIGIIEYHKNDMNNLYCASGKIYEYMHEGLPIVTTENIPLIDLCNTYQVGVADDKFVDGIRKVAADIDTYRENVRKFMENISVEKNNDKLSLKIKQKFQSKTYLES